MAIVQDKVQDQYSLVAGDEGPIPQVERINYLNDRKTRLTLWCMVYFAMTIASNNTFVELLEDSPYWHRLYRDRDVIILSISANSILWCASVMLICNMHCKGCQGINRWLVLNLCSAILFFIGSILSCAAIIREMTIQCIHWDWIDNDSNWCRIKYEGFGLFVQLFSIYLAFDISDSIGDNIRVRLFVTCLCLAATGYLQGTYFFHNWVFTTHSVTICSGYFVIGIMSSIIMLFVFFGYGLNKKMNSYIALIIAFFLLGGVANSSMWLTEYWSTAQYYFSVASFLVVYDLYHL